MNSELGGEKMKSSTKISKFGIAVSLIACALSSLNLILAVIKGTQYGVAITIFISTLVILCSNIVIYKSNKR